MPDERDNKSTGYIKLFRSVRKHWIWKDERKLKWWIDILLEVNHADQKVNIGFELVECKRGQSINSLQSWAKRWLVDVGTVRRFFELLKDDHMIVTENVKKTTRLTVCNYEDYNGEQQDKKFKKNSQRIPDELSTNTNNNDNNDKNIYTGAEAPKKNEEFEKFIDWLKKYAPRVMEMKQPFTVKEFLEIKKFPKQKVSEIITAMHNYKPLLKNNVSSYLTFLNWMKRDEERNGGIQPKTSEGFNDPLAYMKKLN